MRRFGIIILGILLLASIVICIDAQITHAKPVRAQRLHLGDSKKQVKQVLGQPCRIYTPLREARGFAALLSVDSETWAYGSRLELHHPFESSFPYLCPVRLRLFRPDADDVAIEFDSSEKVSKITIP